MTILLIHLVATCFMTGVIWIVQVVHYPLFAKVGEASYVEYQQAHMKRITWVVLPAMGLELITGITLVVPNLMDSIALESSKPALNLDSSLLWGNLLGLVLIWLSTALLQVPQHAKLLEGFNAVPHEKLVRWNWVRTVVWSLRLLLLIYILN